MYIIRGAFCLYGLINITKNVKRLDPILPSIHSTAFYRPMPPEGGGINAFLKMHDNPAPTETRSRRPSDTGEQINHSAGHTFEV
jgi:DNA polymerase III alpha subunit